jgi:hypothetical protein
MTALFGCLYYAGLRPEEAVALRNADCHLPRSGWGMLRLAAATPRTASAWTNSGTSHEQRGLKHRPDGAIRLVPVLRCWPPCSVRTTRPTAAHLTAGCSGGTRGGPLSESVYGRAWHSARALALGPELAASGLARRPYDLRHAALSLWLNAGGGPCPDRRPCRPQRRGPAHRLQPLHPWPRRPPQPADRPRPRALRRTWSVPVRGRASGCTDRATGADAVRYTSVVSPPGPPTARGPRRHQAGTRRHGSLGDSHFPRSNEILERYLNSGPLPDPAHSWPTDLHPRSIKPLALACQSR